MTRVNPDQRPSNSIAQDTIPGISIGSKNVAPWMQWAHDLKAREERGEPAAKAKRDMRRKAPEIELLAEPLAQDDSRWPAGGLRS
jgi:hypothetical protein